MSRRKPKIDPYATLGVSETATRDEIKRAYRNKAKATHPDAQGSHEEFVALERAYATIGNEEARKKYDATGTDARETSFEEKASAVLYKVFIDAVTMIENVETVNLVDAVRRNIKQNMKDIPEKAANLRQSAVKFRTAAKRVKSKDAVNKLASILNGHAEQLDFQARAQEEEVAMGLELLKQLDALEYETDEISTNSIFFSMNSAEFIFKQFPTR